MADNRQTDPGHRPAGSKTAGSQLADTRDLPGMRRGGGQVPGLARQPNAGHASGHVKGHAETEEE